jgi:hypothetical protein
MTVRVERAICCEMQRNPALCPHRPQSPREAASRPRLLNIFVPSPSSLEHNMHKYQPVVHTQSPTHSPNRLLPLTFSTQHEPKTPSRTCRPVWPLPLQIRTVSR